MYENVEKYIKKHANAKKYVNFIKYTIVEKYNVIRTHKAAIAFHKLRYELTHKLK